MEIKKLLKLMVEKSASDLFYRAGSNLRMRIDGKVVCVDEKIVTLDEVNEAVSRDARKLGIIVNVVDDPQRCDFILPSVFQQGDLSIAVSTGGKSPALAKKLARDLPSLYGPEYELLLQIMGELRERMLARGLPSTENRKIFEAVVHSDILHYISKKDQEGVKLIIKDIAGLDIDWGGDGSFVF